MCIGAIVESINGRRGEIISIDVSSKTVVVHGVSGGYWTEKIHCVKVISYIRVM